MEGWKQVEEERRCYIAGIFEDGFEDGGKGHKLRNVVDL